MGGLLALGGGVSGSRESGGPFGDVSRDRGRRAGDLNRGPAGLFKRASGDSNPRTPSSPYSDSSSSSRKTDTTSAFSDGPREGGRSSKGCVVMAGLRPLLTCHVVGAFTVSRDGESS